MKTFTLLSSVIFSLLIHVVCAQNIVSTYAGDGTNGYADGDTATCKFKSPFGLCMDPSGNLYLADNDNHRIRKISTDGTVTTFAGTGVAGYLDGPGSTAKFNAPSDLCADADGNIYVSDFQNQYIRKITPDGTVSTIAGSGIAGYLDGASNVAKFNYPRGICIDANGNLFIGDSWNHRIRKIDVNGNVTTLAGGGDTIGVQSQGNYKDANDTLARFNVPCGMSIDADGNLYVADAYNHRIRKVTPEGVVTTVAGTGDIGSAAGGFEDGSLDVARFNTPTEVFINAEGKIYVGDTYNNRIRLIEDGAVTTVAGNGVQDYVDGIDTVASFAHPRGLVDDASHTHIYVNDGFNHVIRKISLSVATGIQSLDHFENVIVYPNPSNGDFTIPFSEIPILITITDILGRQVFISSDFDPILPFHLQLTTLESGLYSLSVHYENSKVSNEKLMILH